MSATSKVENPGFVLPGTTPIQRAASGLVFTSANASACALSGHFFSLVEPTAGAFFGASAGLVGLGLAAYFALNNLEDCKNMTDLADKIAKTIISFFAGGAAGLLLTNVIGYTITAPAALILLGPVMTTSLGFLALSIACFAALKLAKKGSEALSAVRERIRDQMGDDFAEQMEVKGEGAKTAVEGAAEQGKRAVPFLSPLHPIGREGSFLRA